MSQLFDFKETVRKHCYEYGVSDEDGLKLLEEIYDGFGFRFPEKYDSRSDLMTFFKSTPNENGELRLRR